MHGTQLGNRKLKKLDLPRGHQRLVLFINAAENSTV